MADPMAAQPADLAAAAEGETGSAPQPVDPRLLEMLVCPVSKQTLIYDRANNELVSRAAGLAFPIRGGIPIMLVDEARAIDA